MVLLGRIELPTSPLPRECSTTELQQHISRVATNPKSILRQVYFRYTKGVKKQYGRTLSYKYRNCMQSSKSNKNGTNNRENRLKAALKANMAKRKAQVKARASASSDKLTRKD